MANERGTDASSAAPDGDAVAVQASDLTGSLAGGIPAFPHGHAVPPASPDTPLPPPLKPDGGFRIPPGAAGEARPVLRAVPTRAPSEAAAASQPDDEAAADAPLEAPPEGETPAGRAQRVLGLPLPTGRLRMSRGRRIWFLVSFVVPVILAALYLFAIAPDEYVTEFRFSVRMPINSNPTNTATGAQRLFMFDGNTTPGDDLIDNYTVADYVISRQAALDINGKLNLREMFSRPFDPFSRVGAHASNEKLAAYWHDMVYSSYDPSSGLEVVRVRGYTPQDSYAIATNLVTAASDLVNAIGMQSQQDSVRYAQQEVDRARAQVATLRSQYEDLRRSTAMLMPANNTNGAVEGTQGLIDDLITRRNQINGQIAGLMAQLHNPDAPQIRLLRDQLTANEQQLAGAQRMISGNGSNDLANKLRRFEDVQRRQADANAVVTSAVSNLAIAQAGADAQRLYLTTYVKPTLPESPLLPHRWLDLLITMIACAMIWAIGRLVENSILEHG